VADPDGGQGTDGALFLGRQLTGNEPPRWQCQLAGVETPYPSGISSYVLVALRGGDYLGKQGQMAKGDVDGCQAEGTPPP
jgi:hypothetical protein